MSFFGSLFGSDQEKDLRRAKKKSDAELQAGYDEAQPFYQQAFDIYEPYAASGRAANTAYNALLGLGTDAERDAAQQRYFEDPAQAAILGQNTNRLLRQFNARGSAYDSRAMQAGARAGLDNYNSYLDRVRDQAGFGSQFSGQQGTLRAGQGDLRFSTGLAKAGQETNFGNALAQNRSTGINNLLNIAGTAVKAYAASDIRFKHDIERLGTLPSGLPYYSFKYHGSDQPHIGVIAQEAAKVFPHAVAANEDGYLFVDYSEIN